MKRGIQFKKMSESVRTSRQALEDAIKRIPEASLSTVSGGKPIVVA